ncbi:hypothetical protein I316_02583 [Kwoniella heveanensis BCC8398]|uniref:SMP-30/Gluconolactonase/LRE-like region domain-containing protein n=1 Tax=Kwoniella heveanensis BCC8398 TaxID=1296120 RepID=A0A1B9GWX8_9TREE|nr:hypothetical protein I316_02583 [Kwoniella heveanensis BCC8398]
MSPHSVPIIEAEHLLACQNTLGEGAVWDSKTQLLHWVDIQTSEVHSYDPETSNHSVDKYPEATSVSYITPIDGSDKFLATFEGSLVVLPKPTTPTASTSTTDAHQKTALKVLSEPLDKKQVQDQVIRFNDGGVDPAGRVFYGSMGNDEDAPEYPGELWRYDLDGTQTKIFDKIGVSNGLGFTGDGKLMYYIDSRKDEISVFDYDLQSGVPFNKRTFAATPPPLDNSGPPEGVFDGLCLDGVGNVWAARWRDERVIGFSPEGKILAMISVKGAKSPTIPCFGGKDLTKMYITTASSHLGGKGDSAQFPKSGDLYTVDFGEGSSIRKVLGEGWKGAERFRAKVKIDDI